MPVLSLGLFDRREPLPVVWLPPLMNKPIPHLRTVLGRGLRRRCPQCGEGRVFRGWVKLHDHCSECGLQYLPDQGDLWAYLVVVDRALFIFPLIVLIYFRLYIPSSFWLSVLGIGLLTGFIYTLPHRNGMALGLDYLVRRKWGDLAVDTSPKPPSDRT
jgi:uncharacterized protein (DUF983 family)